MCVFVCVWLIPRLSDDELAIPVSGLAGDNKQHWQEAAATKNQEYQRKRYQLQARGRIEKVQGEGSSWKASAPARKPAGRCRNQLLASIRRIKCSLAAKFLCPRAEPTWHACQVQSTQSVSRNLCDLRMTPAIAAIRTRSACIAAGPEAG